VLGPPGSGVPAGYGAAMPVSKKRKRTKTKRTKSVGVGTLRRQELPRLAAPPWEVYLKAATLGPGEATVAAHLPFALGHPGPNGPVKVGPATMSVATMAQSAGVTAETWAQHAAEMAEAGLMRWDDGRQMLLLTTPPQPSGHELLVEHDPATRLHRELTARGWVEDVEDAPTDQAGRWQTWLPDEAHWDFPASMVDAEESIATDCVMPTYISLHLRDDGPEHEPEWTITTALAGVEDSGACPEHAARIVRTYPCTDEGVDAVMRDVPDLELHRFNGAESLQCQDGPGPCRP
jgi:hypothetical protein